jgi:hypothetical protein
MSRTVACLVIQRRQTLRTRPPHDGARAAREAWPELDAVLPCLREGRVYPPRHCCQRILEHVL